MTKTKVAWRPLTNEVIEETVSRGTTDHKKVTCIYFDDAFALVRWPGGTFWSGTGGNSYVSPWVMRYDMTVLREAIKNGVGAFGAGRTVWDSKRNRDGALTAKRKLALIEREKSCDQAGSRIAGET